MKVVYNIVFGLLLVHTCPTTKASNSKYNSIDESENGHPKYGFSYSVNDETTGDKKSHSESRDGDLTVGEYSLTQPDGGVRRVKYTVDGDSGFKANVHTSFNNLAYQEVPVPAPTTSTALPSTTTQDNGECDPRFRADCPYTESMKCACTRHAECPFKHYCCTNTVQKFDFLQGNCLSIYDVRCN